VDHGIAVRVTGFYGGATASATSAKVRVVKATFTAAPQPVVSGTWFYGKTVTATPGAWAPMPDALTYQWLRDGQPITGAATSTYLLGGDDVGHLVSIRVTGAKAGFTTVQSYSVARTVGGHAFTRTGSAAVSGTAKVGKTVKAKVGKSSPTPKTVAYQWLRNGVAITGATAAKRTLVPADLGSTISVRVTVSKTGYLTVTKTSKSTKKVSAGSLATATPKISGKARVGQVLSAKPGTWRPIGVALTYQWYRNGKAIVGATGIRYTVVVADKGARLKVKVTGALAGYSTASKTSKSTGKVK
jgi:hypothetical protein